MERHVFDRMAELDSAHWWFTARREILAALIARVVRPPKDARILEIGCGTGHNLAMLGKFGRVEANELDDAARALSSKRLGRPVEPGALPDLSAFPAGSYDLIALLDVLEHVPDDATALTAIMERLKPGGKLIVTVPANQWMWSAHDVAHHHHRRYSKSGLAEVAKRSGFKIDLISPFNAILFPLIAAARLVGRVRGKTVADDSMPPKPINAVLEALFGFEKNLVGRVPLPFGVSLVAILRRP
ncbi:MAG: class I SAM-dependent methyltransferase [Sphingomicrobium sp.]